MSMISLLSSTLLFLTHPATATRSFFSNPILPGFHPDPSCIFVPEYNNTFFCATSTFSAFPGLPIYASKDLTNWRLASHAFSRSTQLTNHALTNGSTSGIWAPTLRFHDGTFYVVSTVVFDDAKDASNSSRWENFIMMSNDPFRSDAWSQPVHFEFLGYDTSPFWDSDGTTYISGAHPVFYNPGIYQAEVDFESGHVLSPWLNVWNGTGGLAPEGPHIYFRDGYYYLLIAEGGTGLGHSVTVARSRNVNGPFAAYTSNPVLSQANTTSYFQTVGHADLFNDHMDQWWTVALATRGGPEYVVYPMGRETTLTPATWEAGGWPSIHNVSGHISTSHVFPHAEIVDQGEGPLVGADDDIHFSEGTQIPAHFVYWRAPVPENYVVSPPGHKDKLQLTSSKLNLTGYDGKTTYTVPGGLTFIARRQEHSIFTYSFVMDFSPQHEEEEAGISVFLTQENHYRLGKVLLPLNSSNQQNTALAPHFRIQSISRVLPQEQHTVPMNRTWEGMPLKMEIKAVNLTHYSLSVGPAAHMSWMQTIGYAPAKALSWGFTGTLVGAYCTTNGKNTTTKAFVSEWRYKGEEQFRS